MNQNKLSKIAPVANALDALNLPRASVGLSGIDDELLEKLRLFQDRTISELMLEYLTAEPVKGDSVRLNDTWSLIVKDVDERGRLLVIGLKNKITKE